MSDITGLGLIVLVHSACLVSLLKIRNVSVSPFIQASYSSKNQFALFKDKLQKSLHKLLRAIKLMAFQNFTLVFDL